MFANLGRKPVTSLRAPLPARDDIVRDAAKSSGKSYGGYVRDTILRGSEAKDIDLWFRTHESSNEFKSLIGTKYGATEFETCLPSNRYPFQRSRMNIIGPNDTFINVDIIVCDTMPVNDFQANLVTWDGETLALEQPSADHWGVQVEDDVPLILEDVVADVKEGMLVMSPFYEKKLSNKERFCAGWLRVEAFSDRGWLFANGPFAYASVVEARDKRQKEIDRLAEEVLRAQSKAIKDAEIQASTDKIVDNKYEAHARRQEKRKRKADAIAVAVSEDGEEVPTSEQASKEARNE